MLVTIIVLIIFQMEMEKLISYYLFVQLTIVLKVTFTLTPIERLVITLHDLN